jgi:osmotically-inducible protein OsmY
VSEHEPDAYLTERIREALAHDPRIAELGIAVSVSGDHVLVSGNVATADRRSTVNEVVGPLLGDRVLHNAVTVSPISESSGEEAIT